MDADVSEPNIYEGSKSETEATPKTVLQVLKEAKQSATALAERGLARFDVLVVRLDAMFKNK